MSFWNSLQHIGEKMLDRLEKMQEEIQNYEIKYMSMSDKQLMRKYNELRSSHFRNSNEFYAVKNLLKERGYFQKEE